MRNGYISYHAKCPYYLKESRMSVECSGDGADARVGQESYQVKFHQEKRACSYKRRYCRNVPGCTDCPMFQMLNFEHAAADGEK